MSDFRISFSFQSNFFISLTFMLINFLVRMLQYEQILNMKNYKPTPNTYQQESQILFHKNISTRDLYIMTLILCYAYGLKGVKLQDFISFIFLHHCIVL